MSKKVQNSISESYKYFVKLSTTAIELLTKLEQAFLSNGDSVQFNVELSNGQNRVFTVPTLRSMNLKLQKVENDLRKITNDTKTINGLPVDDYLIVESSPIKGLNLPRQFRIKPNHFFENFLNPILYVTLDISNKIIPITRSIQTKRYVLRPSTSVQTDFIKRKYLNRTDILEQDLRNDLTNQRISFSIDEEMVQLEPSLIKKRGSFNVIAVRPSSPVENTEYVLNTVQYDSLITAGVYEKTSLREGDILITDETTSYVVTSVNSAQDVITVSLIGGTNPIKIGINTLRIASETIVNPELQIPVNYDQLQVVFIREVNPYYNIVNLEWSTGVCFYSNDLSIQTQNGIKNLKEYYMEMVTDYSLLFKAQMLDTTIPSIFAKKPKIPFIDPLNFKALKINGHLQDSNDLEELKRRVQEKIRLEAKILSFDIELSKLYEEYERLQYTRLINPQTEQERTKAAEEKQQIENLRVNIEELLDQKNINLSLLNSVLDQLKKYGRERLRTIESKYRVRGFWAIPDPEFDERTGFQEVIQFVISWRYIRYAGTGDSTSYVSTSQQLEFVGNNGDKRVGFYSPWVEQLTAVRSREYDEILQKYVWKTEDVTNPEITNINQLDIPITPGESIEIKIRSISEAGWPQSIVMSDWSEIVRVDFPQDVLDEEDADVLLKNIEAEDITNQIKILSENNSLQLRNVNAKLVEMQQKILELNAELKALKEG